MGDEKVCHICRALEGFTWTFQTGSGEGLPMEVVADGIVVWDIQQGSEAHGRHGLNCRCHITPEFDLSDLVVKAEKLLSEVEANVQ